MKKRFWSVIFTLILSFGMVTPVMAESQDMWATVYKWEGGIAGADGRLTLTKVTSGITFQVLAVDSNTEETITVYGKSTSLTNPVDYTNFASTSVCNKMVAFRVDPTDATNDRYVDLIVVDLNGGYTAFVENFDKYTHTIIIDERPNVQHHGCIWWKGTTDNTAQNTGIVFDQFSTLHRLTLEVVTVLNGGTISIGTAVTANGFISRELLTTAGFIQTTGASTGSLLGSGTAYQWYQHGVTFTTGASYLYYTSASSAPNLHAGYIHFYFTRTR